MVQLNLTTTVSSINKAIEEAGKSKYRSAGVSASSLGTDCYRRLYYDLHWVTASPDHNAKTLRIFETGNIIEERLIQWLRDAGFEVEDEKSLGKQRRITLCGGFIRGKIDARVMGIPEAPKTIHTVEAKSMNQKNFDELLKKGVRESKPDHFAQIQMYMHDTGDRRGLYMAYNKNTDEIYTERVEYDADFCLRKVAQVQLVVEAEDPPPKLYEDPEKGMAKVVCGWCPHKNKCHAGSFPDDSNCRTCVHVEKHMDGKGTFFCTRHSKPLTLDEQKEGCDYHMFKPSLVPGKVINFDETTHEATYELNDGRTWVDGGKPLGLNEQRSAF